MSNDPRDLPIGIFDSGVGGLTVLSAVSRLLPEEDLVYLGDTARLPYGTKSGDTITRYALQATARLVEREIKLLVVACNTATAAALPALRAAYPGLPVVGVVRPGAEAACKASPGGRILVLATESTVNNRAYQKAIAAIRPEASVTGVACSLFVSLAEEGWTDGPITEAVAVRYLEHARQAHGTPGPDCIVLGCTHFPPLAPAIARAAGPGVILVDSAESTAIAVKRDLHRLGLDRGLGKGRGRTVFLTTDNVARFARAGSIFLGRAVEEKDVELVTL